MGDLQPGQRLRIELQLATGRIEVEGELLAVADDGTTRIRFDDVAEEDVQRLLRHHVDLEVSPGPSRGPSQLFGAQCLPLGSSRPRRRRGPTPDPWATWQGDASARAGAEGSHHPPGSDPLLPPGPGTGDRQYLRIQQDGESRATAWEIARQAGAPPLVGEVLSAAHRNWNEVRGPLCAATPVSSSIAEVASPSQAARLAGEVVSILESAGFTLGHRGRILVALHAHDRQIEIDPCEQSAPATALIESVTQTANASSDEAFDVALRAMIEGLKLLLTQKSTVPASGRRSR